MRKKPRASRLNGDNIFWQPKYILYTVYLAKLNDFPITF